MVYLSVIALTVKTVVVPLAGTAAKKAVRVGVPIAVDLVGEWVGNEIRRKVQTGQARSRLEALGQTFDEWKQWFANRPGRSAATEAFGSEG